MICWQLSVADCSIWITAHRIGFKQKKCSQTLRKNRHQIVKKPEPIFNQPERAECPVCGKPSYSAGGIHPQCAVQLEDKQRVEKLKQESKRKSTKPGSAKSIWQKVCPKCRDIMHVRKKQCACGHKFEEQSRAGSEDADVS